MGPHHGCGVPDGVVTTLFKAARERARHDIEPAEHGHAVRLAA
jgi:hypothetical protein